MLGAKVHPGQRAGSGTGRDKRGTGTRGQGPWGQGQTGDKDNGDGDNGQGQGGQGRGRSLPSASFRQNPANLAFSKVRYRWVRSPILSEICGVGAGGPWLSSGDPPGHPQMPGE